MPYRFLSVRWTEKSPFFRTVGPFFRRADCATTARSETSSESPPEIAGVRYAGQVEIRTLQIFLCGIEQRGRTVDVTRAFGCPPYLDALQYLALQGPAQSLDRLQTILLGRGFQFFDRTDAELPVQLQHLVGTQPRDGKHLQHALGHLLAELLKGWMGAGPVQPGDDVGDRIADPGNFLQPPFVHDAAERLGQSGQIFGGPDVGLGAVGIAATKRRTAAVLRQQSRHLRCVKLRHGGVLWEVQRGSPGRRSRMEPLVAMPVVHEQRSIHAAYIDRAAQGRQTLCPPEQDWPIH